MRLDHWCGRACAENHRRPDRQNLSLVWYGSSGPIDASPLADATTKSYATKVASSDVRIGPAGEWAGWAGRAGKYTTRLHTPPAPHTAPDRGRNATLIKAS